MNLADYANYVAVGTNTSTVTLDSIADAAIYTTDNWLVGGGGSGRQTVTIGTDTTINRDLWESLTTNTTSDIEYVSIRPGWRVNHVTIDNSIREWINIPPIQCVRDHEESEPCDAIPDDELAKLL